MSDAFDDALKFQPTESLSLREIPWAKIHSDLNWEYLENYSAHPQQIFWGTMTYYTFGWHIKILMNTIEIFIEEI